MNIASPVSRRQLFSSLLRRSSNANAAVTPKATPAAARPVPTNPQSQPIDPTPAPGSQQDGELAAGRMPELHQSLLDAVTLDALFRDIAQCTQVLEVVPRTARRQFVQNGSVTLDQGRQMLTTGQARALQIRYRYDGAQWWDTLVREADGVRIVRIRHQF